MCFKEIVIFHTILFAAWMRQFIICCIFFSFFTSPSAMHFLQALGPALGTASVHTHVWSEKREKSATNKERGEHSRGRGLYKKPKIPFLPPKTPRRKNGQFSESFFVTSPKICFSNQPTLKLHRCEPVFILSLNKWVSTKYRWIGNLSWILLTRPDLL